MKKISITEGVISVMIASCSYGILATVAKLAMQDGYAFHNLTFSQAFVGLIGLLLLNIFKGFSTKKNGAKPVVVKGKDKLKLIFGGLFIALTSITYYLSLQYIPVAICMVLIMQSAWMGTLLELFINNKKPTKITLISIVLILIGTLLATDIFNQSLELDYRGVLWGLLSGVCYTFSLFSSNRIAVQYPPLKRSLYLVLGSLSVISIAFFSELQKSLTFEFIYTWGIALGLLGTVIPLLLFTRGMPVIGIGLGTIVASMELPSSAIMAYFVLEERISFLGWIGIFLILFAISINNIRTINFRKFIKR